MKDYRKHCLWRILIPYLVNIKKLSNEETTKVLNEWLQNCNQLRKLDFIPRQYIKNDLRNVGQYLPPSKVKLKQEQIELYQILKSKNTISE